jgi:hypothetical protein
VLARRHLGPLHLNVHVYWRCSVPFIKYRQGLRPPASSKEGADFPLDYKWLLNPHGTFDLSVLFRDTHTHTVCSSVGIRGLSDVIKQAVGGRVFCRGTNNLTCASNFVRPVRKQLHQLSVSWPKHSVSENSFMKIPGLCRKKTDNRLVAACGWTWFTVIPQCNGDLVTQLKGRLKWPLIKHSARILHCYTSCNGHYFVPINKQYFQNLYICHKIACL